MFQFWRRYTWKSKSVLVFMVFALGMSILGNLTVLDMIGEADIQAWLYWDPGYECYRVSPLSSPKWEPLRTKALYIGDCLIAVDDIPLQDEARLSAHLEAVYARGQSLRTVAAEGYRNGKLFHVDLSVMRWTLLDILRAQLLVVLPGLALWLIGVLVFLAQPESTTNQSLAAFLLLAGMLLMSINHWFDNYVVNTLYDLAVNRLPRALLPVFIVKTALDFPEPMRNPRRRKILLSIFLGVAGAASLGYAFVYIIFSDHNQFIIRLERGIHTVLAISFLIASSFFVGRSWRLMRHESNPRIRQQATFIMLALLTSLPLVILDAIATIPNHSWVFTRFSNLTAVGWIIPGAAMLAYAMLRYQAFAYRGQFLSLLLIFFISATIVQVYTMVFMLGQVDGVEWVALWGAVFITTALFYVDSPLRRKFIRYFARHYYDYEIINQFSRQIEPNRDLKSLIQESVEMLCGHLEVEWVCIWSALLPDRLFLGRFGEETPREIRLTERPDATFCPTPLVHEEQLEEGNAHLGNIWFGPRVTAEPFDEGDQRLAHLLAMELARVMALRSYITQLEETPGLILAAVDRERRRIGQDIHDGVLQFLGVLPLSLERAKLLWRKDRARADEVLDGLVEQSQRVTEDARAMVYDLSLPGIRRGELLTMAYQYVSTMCSASGVQLQWEVEQGNGWEEVRGDEAVHVFRILQEGVHNAIRHGNPKVVIVRWKVENGRFVLEISDDGKGIATLKPPPSPGLGLVSMRERARVLGGLLHISSDPLQGTTLRLVFPAS